MQSHKKVPIKETVVVDAAFLKTLARTVEQLVKDVRVLKQAQPSAELHNFHSPMYDFKTENVEPHTTGSLYVDAEFHTKVSRTENKERAEQLNAELESLFAEFDICSIKVKYQN